MKNPALKSELKEVISLSRPVFDGDRKRNTIARKESESESDSESDDGEEADLHEKLIKLIQKHKELDKESSSSDSNSEVS